MSILRPVVPAEEPLGFEIRAVAPGEAEQAGEIVLAAYRSLPCDVLGDGYGGRLRDVAARTAGATVLVAVDGDRVLGSVTLVDDPASPWSESLVAGEIGIRMLGVDPAAGGRGVGTALVSECLARGRALGAARAVLHTTKDMTVAHRIYRRAGFLRAPERDVLLPGFHLMAFTLALG
ncbi:MAG: GNAT family N-acetyltransferase [Acidimicrobiales bacterium]